ncbi:metal ABC transporter substrate-binding protein [Pelosinus sp. IPA-1]|uniref:metal ABC transporter substrate-binding protein n=1 Tax=Pelosinus sp. IPA-1 TaxID=3029569 RepID=UPI0024361DE9|nr:metal ABC transporter substrate-binding protein [Pelosinus sp. IPA-1]GMA97542.1 zinc ABC transporter substrate-binding protein [Pelosinus sp. IPA-1]
MKKKWSIALILLVAVLSMAGCGGMKSAAPEGAQKIKVVATMYPVYEFVKQVGGDKVDVVMLIPPGAEPHDWEPTAKDIIQIKDAKIFAYHGIGFEPVEKLLKKDVLGNAIPLEITKDVTKLPASHEDEEEEHGHSHGEDHKYDPHTWLDPVSVQQEVNTIAQALASVDEKNAEVYKKNAETYNKKLADLDEKYKKTLSGMTNKEIVTSHKAFAYLANRYGFEQLGIMGISPDAEPTPDKMAKITEFCREHKVKYIFFETLTSPKLAQTIAKETGAQLLVLNPIESLTEQETKEGKDYIAIMNENLVNLEKALK